MKRCPECRRDYFDDSLLYCLEDGVALVQGSVPARGSDEDGPTTAILNEAAPASEAATRAQIHTTDRTAVLPSGVVDEPKAKSFDKRLIMVTLTLATVILGGFAGYRYFAPTSNEQINSIAVLPFENRSGSADADYLSDGLTDSLIFRFSQLPNLKVSPTSSVMRYKGKETDVEQIARELDVDAVLSGRLMQVGDGLNISVQLIDARTKKLIWAEQYDRKMADLLATQREIAATLTQKMQPRLTGDERGITKKYTNSNEAYQLYMKGRFHWARRFKDDLHKAIENYKQAISLDPNFALAYVGIATAYNSMGKNPDAAPKDSFPFGKAAALKALEIDPMLPDAHAALADALVLYDWNWAEGERAFNRAIELDPNISYSHLTYGASFLNAAGRADEYAREMETALELEPLALINNSLLAMSYILIRQNDKALLQGQKAYDLDPDFPLAAFALGLAYIANGRAGDAVKLGEVALVKSPASQNILFLTGLAYANDNRPADASRIINKLNELSESQYVRRYYVACIYAALGEKDKAFAELDRAAADKDAYLPRSRLDPMLDPLRDDPRFKNLMKRMNLPQ